MAPQVAGIAAAFIAGGFGCGLLLLAVFIRGVEDNPGKPPGRLQRLQAIVSSPAVTSRLAAALVVGVLTLVLTRWPVAAIGMGALVLSWPLLFGGQRFEQSQINQLEALVMWTESLRDTITARASLEQAISATAQSVPEAIRPEMVRLLGLVRSRVPLERALLALSADLNDASADKVIGALILNTRQRGTGLAAVLTALAKSAREELDQRRRISAGRSSMRRSVQIVAGITVGMAIFLSVGARAYVRPYGSVGGQIALAVVVGLFAAGFAWMRRLAGGEPSTPFLVRPVARFDEAELRIVGHLTGLTATEAEELAANRSAVTETSVPVGERR